MPKHTAVIFTSNNARLIPFDHFDELPQTANILVDPDLTQVDGIAPHYWKCVDNKIIPMTELEKMDRDHDHVERGVDNRVDVIVPHQQYPRGVDKLEKKMSQVSENNLALLSQINQELSDHTNHLKGLMDHLIGLNQGVQGVSETITKEVGVNLKKDMITCANFLGGVLNGFYKRVFIMMIVHAVLLATIACLLIFKK